jgi:CRP-like cAMP-binding protein
MALQDDISFLERVPMLRLLGRPALQILAIGAESRYVHGGEVLFYKDEASDGGYIVQEGSFSLGHGKDRSETIVGPGTLLGEFSLISETARPFTACALEPSTVVRISRSLFKKMLESQPDAARRLRDHLASRTDQTVKDISAVKNMLEQKPR